MTHMTSDRVITISCDTCPKRASPTCHDCVVTVVFDHQTADAVVLDLDEQRAVRLLAAAGLVPTLRHREAI